MFHDLQIGFIGTIGFAHVRHFNDHVDVGIADIAALIRCGMARLVLLDEGRRILADFRNADFGGAGALFQLGAEGNRLAAIGIGFGSLRSGLRIGDVFGNNTQTRRLGRKARRCDLQCALQGIRRHNYPFATESIMR